MLNPTQIRTIDPFEDYNSNVTNRLTRFVSRGNNCLHGPHDIDVAITDTTSVIVSGGFCFKDDVLIQLSADNIVDLLDPNSYFFAGTQLEENGDYYICLKYTYSKIKPAPQAGIGILRPSETSEFLNPSNLYLFLKIIRVTGGVITELFNFDQITTTIKREYSQVYVGLEDTLPDFDRTRDEGRIIISLDDNEFYYGTWDAWINFNTSHCIVNTEGVDKGDLVYFDDLTGESKKAIAISYESMAKAAVLAIGPAYGSPETGKVCLFGRVKQVNIESGITVTAGDSLFLSDSEEGKITNISPASFQQFIGTSLTTGDTTAEIWFLPNFKGSGGAGSGSSFEDEIYSTLLNSSSFEKMYYDTFTNNTSITTSGASYNFGGSYYSGNNLDTLITPEILDSTSTDYRFFVHIEKDDDLNVTTRYSKDDGTSWVTISPETTITVSSGFTTLKIEVIWNGTGNIYSFGVLYKQLYNTFTSDTKLLNKVTILEDQIAPYKITIPYNQAYTKDGKSLAIYRNGVRLILDEHYQETDSISITFLVNLKINDIILFEEKYGYVDVSFENYQRIDQLIAGSIKTGDADKLDGYHVEQLLPTGSIVSYGSKTTPSGFLSCDGIVVNRITYLTLFNILTRSAECTFDIDTDIATSNLHGFNDSDKISFESTGALPTGLVVGTDYYVKFIDISTFKVSTTPGGADIDLTGTQNGVHIVRYNPYGCGDGSTTFNVPNISGTSTIMSYIIRY